MADTTIIGVVIGALATFAFAVLYYELRSPDVKLGRKATQFLIDIVLDTVILSGHEDGTTTKTRVTAYRVAAENSQKMTLNAPARNCVAWLELDGVGERYQLPWVGGLTTVTINVGDQREIDLCAELGALIFGPTEHGYPSNPRTLGRRGDHLKGWLWVTSENGKRDKVRIQIEGKEQGYGLEVSFPKS